MADQAAPFEAPDDEQREHVPDERSYPLDSGLGARVRVGDPKELLHVAEYTLDGPPRSKAVAVVGLSQSRTLMVLPLRLPECVRGDAIGGLPRGWQGWCMGGGGH